MPNNGTNFLGASKTLLEEYLIFLKESAKDVYTLGKNVYNQPKTYIKVYGFEWSFVPPSPPHMEGLWEAGVKSLKLHFRKVVGNQKFIFDEFSAVISDDLRS